MTILEEIQNAAVDSKSDLGEVLRKCKVLAARLGSQPLKDWLIWESNGYPEDAPVPSYRTWSLEVLGDFAGPFGAEIRNARIPIGLLKFIPDHAKKFYSDWSCRQSVASTEQMLREAESIDRLTVGTGNLTVLIGTKLYTGYNCVHTWATFGKGHLVELLNSVRNRVLDFALAIGKEAPNAGELGAASGTKPDPDRVNQIFNTTVYGGAANIVGTATASSIEFNIGPRDFSALERLLTEKGVSTDDVSELKQALESDPTPSSPKSYGPKVSAWIGKMVAIQSLHKYTH